MLWQNRAQKLLFVVSSTYGHLFPAIRLAHLAQDNGHEVLFVTSKTMVPLIDLSGLPHLAFDGNMHPFLATTNWYDPQVAAQQHNVLLDVLEQFQADRIVTTPLVNAAFTAGDKFQCPVTVLGYAEYFFPGLDGSAPEKAWRLDSLTGHFNDLQSALGLPAKKPECARRIMTGDRYLLRSIPEFHDQTGLPEQVHYIGAFLWEPPCHLSMVNRSVRAFKDQGLPVYYVQIGRLFEKSEAFARFIELLAEQEAAFVVDLGRADYLTSHVEFPENVYPASFVPFGAISDHIDGVICAGQTSITLSALSHGHPILIVPDSGDGSEVAQRVMNHGLGVACIGLDNLTGAALTQARYSIEAKVFDARCKHFAAKFKAYDNDSDIYEKAFA